MCGSIFYNGSLTHIRFVIFDTSGASTSCVALLAFLIEVQPEYCFKKDLAKPRHSTLQDTYPLQLNITKSTKGEKETCNSIFVVYSMIEARLEPPRRSLYHTACLSNGDELTASATISVECKVIVQAKMQAGELRNVSAWRVIVSTDTMHNRQHASNDGGHGKCATATDVDQPSSSTQERETFTSFHFSFKLPPRIQRRKSLRPRRPLVDLL